YSSADDGTTETTTWILAALARWYFSNGSSLSPFVQGEVGIGNVDLGPSDDDLIRLGVGVGVLQFVTASTAIEALLAYRAASFDESDIDASGFAVELAYSVFW
ncbi:MAG: hypothetical protein O3A20_04390, partial [Planctomycetota bacterium]|nr:hypothetical protein [Planctomycetota bacterium]